MDWVSGYIENNAFVRALSDEKKQIDLTPYLEAIYDQSAKGMDRYNENGNPFIIEQEDYKLILTELVGKKLENEEIELGRYVQGYLLVK